MTPAQKRDARLKLLAHEEQTEQFYYDKAQRRYLKELAEEMQNRRAILKAEEAKMRESGAAARARATNKRLELVPLKKQYEMSKSHYKEQNT